MIVLYHILREPNQAMTDLKVLHRKLSIVEIIDF